MAVIRSTSLTLTSERHHKSYAVAIEEAGDGFIVTFAYGAIGAPQKPGTKTNKPVSLAEAEKVFDRLIKDKTGKPCDCCQGVYVAVESSAKPIARTQATAGDNHSRFTPALLAPVDALAAARYISNPAYGAQRKYDGVRMAISHRDGETIAYNRLGGVIPVPDAVAEKLPAITLSPEWMLDGEYAGGEYIAFDLLELGGDNRSIPMRERHQRLSDLLHSTGIKVARLAMTETEKKLLILEEYDHRGEGVVFKKLGAPVMPGRVGVDCKFKFWESCTVRVRAKEKEDSHHSFAVEALRAGEWVSIGRVTCKGPLPAIGTYRECKYLYLGTGNRLYQPEDLGARTDVTDADCAFDKLKLKQAAERLAA